ncbi:hypothetical protein [Salipiger mangrovisoli]|uniref:Uncharacterized protein n=1 Tax=Salipiger mangrovisoli TaxID=2865933 RepID=A0ABR9X4K2_9RHOB|nr:hypothetical protein [Salipiger mangrovisoli]MBE9638388.1 hypothetical protein [Salipiger mangrovisoli]
MKTVIAALVLAALPLPALAQLKGCAPDKNGITRCPGASTFSTDQLGITRETRSAPQTTDRNGIVRDNTGGGYFIAPGDPTADRGGSVSPVRPPSTTRRAEKNCTTDRDGIVRCE